MADHIRVVTSAWAECPYTCTGWQALPESHPHIEIPTNSHEVWCASQMRPLGHGFPHPRAKALCGHLRGSERLAEGIYRGGCQRPLEGSAERFSAR
jgi:hypothetical protein